MKLMVQHLNCGSHFWVSHFKDALQKLVVIQRSPNREMPCQAVISGRKWASKPREENTSVMHDYSNKYLEAYCVEEGLALLLY